MNSKRTLGIILAATVLLPALAAWGQGVGGNSPRPTSFTIQPVYAAPPGSIHWATDIGSRQLPLGIELDPAGPAWSKSFTPVPGEPGGWDTILPTEVVGIREYISIQGDLAWSGWGTRILTGGFVWSDGVWPVGSGLRVGGTDGFAVPGLSVQYVGPIAYASFHPLGAGTHLEIRHRIVFTGQVPFSGTLQLEQFPIPEPSTLAALIVLTGLSFRRPVRSVFTG